MEPLPPKPMLIVAVFIYILAVINMMARTASVAVSDAWLKQTAEDGNKKAKKLIKLLEKSSAAVIDGLELFSFLLDICLIISLVSGLYKPIYMGINLNNDILCGVLTLIIIALIVWLVHSVLIVFVPKRIAAKSSERLSLSLCGYSRMITNIMKPFLAVFVFLGSIISRIFGVKEEDIGEEVTEEEIRMMVDIGSESGAIDDDEKQMIHNIFEMSDKPVDEIMTHRKEASILWIEDSLEDWKKFIDETNHTRYPVCKESVDDVIGIINSRDFYRLLLSGGTDVNTIMRDVFFIPDTIKADELLSRMQSENEHMGIVMDEYGGFQGIVTQEDLIEEIIGELYSEYDEPEIIEDDYIKKLDENQWLIDGSAEIEDVEEELDIRIADGDYNTFAGYVLSELQTIPADGEVLELETEFMKIKVTSVVDHRIEKAEVTVIPQAHDEEEDDE